MKAQNDFLFQTQFFKKIIEKYNTPELEPDLVDEMAVSLKIYTQNLQKAEDLIEVLDDYKKSHFLYFKDLIQEEKIIYFCTNWKTQRKYKIFAWKS